MANFIQTGYVCKNCNFMLQLEKGKKETSVECFFFSSTSLEYRNPNGDATPTSKHSIDLESLKHLGSNSHYTESLPAPSLLSSSTAAILSSQNQPPTFPDISPSISTIVKNQKSIDDAIVTKPESNDGRFDVLVESMQQSQFIHHALSSAKNRHRRSLSMSSANGILKRRLISKRYIVKRNFPNNQLSKISTEMDLDDSNETELDEGENDEYIERVKEVTDEEEEDEKSQEKQQNILNGHDRLDEGDNGSDLEKSIKLFVPYWDAYDTVNQLFLEISKYTITYAYRTNGMTNHHLLVILYSFDLLSIIRPTKINWEQYV